MCAMENNVFFSPKHLVPHGEKREFCSRFHLKFNKLQMKLITISEISGRQFFAVAIVSRD